jgi:hexosaminidase
VRDGWPHGGFYSQTELRALVAYAAARHVTILPEIDMPGHSQAAIAAYPALGNGTTPVAVSTQWIGQGHIFNLEDDTFAFLEDVLREVFAVFPSPLVHLGGDEVILREWTNSPAVQARKAALGFTDDAELETWFANRMTAFVVGEGRRVIGWDEILRPGLDPSVAVMSWRGTGPGVQAARAGRDVVMAPLGALYFDHANGLPLPSADQAILETAPVPGAAPAFVTTVEEVYAYDPMPAELDSAAGAHVLGAQAQHWSEWIADQDDLDRQAFPRLAAFAEIVWTPAAAREPLDFAKRLALHRRRLDAYGVRGYVPAVAP